MDKIETYEYIDGKLIRKVKKRDNSYGVSYISVSVPYEIVTPEDYDSQWLRLKNKPEVLNPKREVRMVDLFSGTGPMSLGIVEAGRALEIDIKPIKIVNYITNEILTI